MNNKPYSVVRFNGLNEDEIKDLVGERLMPPHLCMGFVYLYIYTQEGIRECHIGDWVVKDSAGNIYLFKNEELNLE